MNRCTVIFDAWLYFHAPLSFPLNKTKRVWSRLMRALNMYAAFLCAVYLIQYLEPDVGIKLLELAIESQKP